MLSLYEVVPRGVCRLNRHLASTWNCKICRVLPKRIESVMVQVILSGLKDELKKLCQLNEDLLNMLKFKNSECEIQRNEICLLQEALKQS